MSRGPLNKAEDRGGGVDPLSDAEVARMRERPRFRAAAEASALSALADYERQDAATRWLLNDLGRAALCWGAVIMDGLPGGLTGTRLVAAAVANGVCSRGRAVAFGQYALSRGFFDLEPGPEPWVHRRLILTPAFMAPLRRLMRGALEAAALAAPEIADVLPALKTDAGMQAAVSAAARITLTHRELAHNPGGPLRQIFLARNGGMRVLQHLMLSQAAGRTRLLEAADLSRSDLARRYGVSRTHINRLLEDAQAVGALSLPSAQRVIFSQAFSDEAEAYFAGQIQVMRLVAQSLPDGAAEA